ncbi:unnamed protein product [Arabis nemorensis]|uniref:NYN domain-containing protein n=1 Tax=Arabis nemorensis TaxID=586526 RepID=A0A565APE0_9BRAS|nr:unnamed protein product [Arabis nemorensis]
MDEPCSCVLLISSDHGYKRFLEKLRQENVLVYIMFPRGSTYVVLLEEAIKCDVFHKLSDGTFIWKLPKDLDHKELGPQHGKPPRHGPPSSVPRNRQRTNFC